MLTQIIPPVPFPKPTPPKKALTVLGALATEKDTFSYLKRFVVEKRWLTNGEGDETLSLVHVTQQVQPQAWAKLSLSFFWLSGDKRNLFSTWDEGSRLNA